MLLRTTIDRWLHCQVSWIYLETILASPDIHRSLPCELKRFQGVDKI
jgi:hypothetical protein